MTNIDITRHNVVIIKKAIDTLKNGNEVGMVFDHGDKEIINVFIALKKKGLG